MLEGHNFARGCSVRQVLTSGQVQAVRGQHRQVTVASRAAKLVAGEGTIDVEFDDRVELAGLLEDLEPVPAFVLLRHKVHVLIVTHDLVGRLVLLSLTAYCDI